MYEKMGAIRYVIMVMLLLLMAPDADQDGAAVAVQPEVLHLPAGVQRELVTECTEC